MSNIESDKIYYREVDLKHPPKKTYKIMRARMAVTDKDLAHRIFRYRLDNGLTQRVFAKLSGVNQCVTSNAESGKGISIPNRYKIVKFLDSQTPQGT